MITEILVSELGMAVVGLVFFGPRAIEETHEPWLSRWCDWAEQHLENDFEAVWYDWNCTNHHPQGWYDEEFEMWLDENGFEPWEKENYLALTKLEKYLVKHKYVKRMWYWNHPVYQINKKRFY